MTWTSFDAPAALKKWQKKGEQCAVALILPGKGLPEIRAFKTGEGQFRWEAVSAPPDFGEALSGKNRRHQTTNQ